MSSALNLHVPDAYSSKPTGLTPCILVLVPQGSGRFLLWRSKLKPIRFGSVCSGIEAASVAWNPLGWHAAWFSEIEPFPCQVLKHHYPEVTNLGDMTRLPKMIMDGEVEAPDVFCGGTPCQAFSVAGLRRSLDDARGNLSLTFCEIADAIDNIRVSRGDEECIVFWENVPGVLSTKDNAFGCFLAELAGESVPLNPPGGKWANAGYVSGPKRAVAWRTLDAQYFGVAQRRRRVFVVASARAGFDPAEILFEFDGVRRDSAPSREAEFDKQSLCLQGAGRTSQQANGSTLKFDASFTLNTTDVHGVVTEDAARDFTATECERLQGFPDGYTAIPWRNKPASECPDGPRYKALGNSWAVPNVRWIGRRIDAHIRAHSGSIIEPLGA